MNFASVKHALTWFFNRDFDRSPQELRSPSMVFYGTAYRCDDIEANWNAYNRIKEVLESVSIRDLRVLEAAFLRDGGTNSQKAQMCGVRNRHSYWYIKTRLMRRLEGAFLVAGLISPPRTEPPKYA